MLCSGLVDVDVLTRDTYLQPEHPPVMGGKMSKHSGGIKGCKYQTSSWHLNRFPDADNIGSTV